ncbi:hypothetical protein ABEB36_015097 [Hypothenemus hampei]|uniref:Envelope protein n=1 Tax=Hypothenemus hampei TaxID=57062 RepID=A0ABD1E0G3_HYPHA
MNKFQETIKEINENSNTVTKEISAIKDEINLILSIQDQHFQINNLKQLLEKILRIFSFAHLETLDIEVITSNEIREIWLYLKQHYPKNTLWSIGHMSELTLICKAGIVILDEMVILTIKIPVFEQSMCNLNIVYPIPNNVSKIIISPSRYYCNELWYKSCQEISDKWVCSNPLIDSCILSQNCQYATVQNNYYVHVVTYKNALLTCSKTTEVIYENCLKFKEIHLKGCYLVQSQCDVIVNQHKYSLVLNNVSVAIPEVTNVISTNLTLNLKIKHLKDPPSIQEDLFEPIQFEGLVSYSNIYFIIGISIVIMSSVCGLTLLVYQWKKYKHLNYIPVKTLQKLINEDVEKTKEGGEISPN